MLLLLLLLGEKRRKVSFEIEIQSSDKDGNFDFQELTEFLKQLQYIHNRAIRLTQKEYQGREFEEAEILDYHKLSIEKITQNSPLTLLISFTIDVDYFVPYISVVKIFFKLCKIYGSNTDHLKDKANNTYESIRNFLYDNSKRYIGLNSTEKETINSDVFYTKLMKLMDDERFRNSYNSFCRTGIRFTKIISNIEQVIGFIEENILED